MNVYNKYNKGNKRIEVVGRNPNFVLVGIQEKLDWIHSFLLNANDSCN